MLTKKTFLSCFVHVLKIWKGFEFLKHIKILKFEGNCCEVWKKLYRQAQTKYLKLKTEHKQNSKRPKKILYLNNFLPLLPKFCFSRGVWVRGNNSIQFWGFPNIFFFTKILNLIRSVTREANFTQISLY